MSSDQALESNLAMTLWFTILIFTCQKLFQVQWATLPTGGWHQHGHQNCKAMPTPSWVHSKRTVCTLSNSSGKETLVIAFLFGQKWRTVLYNVFRNYLNSFNPNIMFTFEKSQVHTLLGHPGAPRR